MNSCGILFCILVIWCCGACIALDDWDQFELIWEDEFDTLDPSKWQHEITAWGGGNWEFEFYSQDPANSFVQDSVLHIRATLLINNTNPATGEQYGESFMHSGVLDVVALYGNCTNSENSGCYRTGQAGNIPPVMSARLRTFEKFDFTFGRAVVRAKMPVGDWKWPAMWLLPEDWVYGGWPMSGEIDITEIIGNRQFTDTSGNWLGIQKMGSTLHWGTAWNQNRYYLTHNTHLNESSNFGDNFHTYILDWSTNGLRFFVDDEDQSILDVPYPLIDQNPSWVDFYEFGKPWDNGTVNPWINGSNLAPFDQGFHFILNVAVGTTNGFIPDDCINQNGENHYQKPWRNTDSYEVAMSKFFNSYHNWLWTWEDEQENGDLQVDYIRVYQKTV